MVDDKLSFAQHVDNQLKKANKRLYFARSMRKLNVSSNVISLFYNSTIYTVLSYANIAFYDMLPTYLKHDLNRPRNICRKLVNNEFYELSDNSTLYKLKSFKTATKIIKDSTHPLHTEYEYLPSGRRLRVPRARTNRFKYSFVPRSIHLINNM